jgi:hypothetical protein
MWERWCLQIPWALDVYYRDSFTINKNEETWHDASKKLGLEINIQKTKYMLVSRHQTADQSPDIKTVNRSFENISQFQYFGAAVTNQYDSGGN